MMIRNNNFPFYKQLDMMDCGPTCIRMIAKYYGKSYSLQYLREITNKSKTGVTLMALSDASEKIGLKTLGVRSTLELIQKENTVPFVAFWNQNHFIVVYKITKNKVYLADPMQGRLVMNKEEFKKNWYRNQGDSNHQNGIALLIEPTPLFYELDMDIKNADISRKINFTFFAKYFLPYKNLIFQILLGMVLGNIFTLIAPFLTQSLVDDGIGSKQMNFVYMILIAQLMVFFGQTSVSIIRSWLVLHLSTRINIAIISSFLMKLMKLPLGFFDRKNLGDILQRIYDHKRIESFISGQSLEILFAMFNLIVYSFIILKYSNQLFFVFVGFSIANIAWVLLFLKQRKNLDYSRFNASSANQNSEVELIQAMQEIKLNTSEKYKRWQWERIQIRLFNVAKKTLGLEQLQNNGALLISRLQDIVVTIWAAKEVIEGDMTLGMMMAVTQILGQLNAPISQFVSFIQQGQDAKISLERLGEVHNLPEEEKSENLITNIPDRQDIVLKNLSFSYDNAKTWVLDNVNIRIPYGKTTAIVGESGSGKTTLLKLLLKFYTPQKGDIFLGDVPLELINPSSWRKKCGVVMQEGYIFSDTIANNIAIGIVTPKTENLLEAIEIANASNFVKSLPLGYHTKIGSEGKQLSTGQKQRLMIARAAYKKPDFLFFDEATSSLDAKNEREISEKLNVFNKNRTAIIIAHRLSTVKKADQIIVLDKGKVAELGTHEELSLQKGIYYNLVKNQLELSNS